MGKTVYVILAFHDHELLWDLPGQLQLSLSDLRMVDAVLGENYIRKRLKEGRNIYRRLLAFCRELNAPATLDITNELLYQLATIWPQALEDLKGGYREGLMYPLLTTAHHTHALFLDEAELAEEIALNEDFLNEIPVSQKIWRPLTISEALWKKKPIISLFMSVDHPGKRIIYLSTVQSP